MNIVSGIVSGGPGHFRGVYNFLEFGFCFCGFPYVFFVVHCFFCFSGVGVVKAGFWVLVLGESCYFLRCSFGGGEVYFNVCEEVGEEFFLFGFCEFLYFLGE